MDITPQISVDAKVIQSYGPGGFLIGNEVFRQPVFVLPDRVIPWCAPALADLTAADFDAIAHEAAPVEVVLFGCPGGTMIPSRLRAALKELGLSIDAMDTGAACRTYNVLLSESRKVAAALWMG
jgi:uncharacterized protein